MSDVDEDAYLSDVEGQEETRRGEDEEVQSWLTGHAAQFWTKLNVDFLFIYLYRWIDG